MKELVDIRSSSLARGVGECGGGRGSVDGPMAGNLSMCVVCVF